MLSPSTAPRWKMQMSVFFRVAAAVSASSARVRNSGGTPNVRSVNPLLFRNIRLGIVRISLPPAVLSVVLKLRRTKDETDRPHVALASRIGIHFEISPDHGFELPGISCRQQRIQHGHHRVDRHR
jgi:hypothetical protein